MALPVLCCNTFPWMTRSRLCECNCTICRSTRVPFQSALMWNGFSVRHGRRLPRSCGPNGTPRRARSSRAIAGTRHLAHRWPSPTLAAGRPAGRVTGGSSLAATVHSPSRRRSARCAHCQIPLAPAWIHAPRCGQRSSYRRAVAPRSSSSSAPRPAPMPRAPWSRATATRTWTRSLPRSAGNGTRCSAPCR